MDGSTRQLVVSTLEQWVAAHEEPDLPALSIGLGTSLSPRQICNQVSENTEIGALIVQMIEAGAERTSMDEVLWSFTHPWPVYA